MKYFLILLFPLLLIPNSTFAQENTEEVVNSLDYQMNQIFEKSNSYQQYKVIPKLKLAELRQNVLDSIAALDKVVYQQQSDLARQQNEVDSLSSQLHRTEKELEQTKLEVDGITFFGSTISKTTYNSIMWGAIGILLAFGLLFYFRFSSSHKTIKESQAKVGELETEIEELRRNHLEREQKLRRQLQDEINKNRNV